MGGVADGDTHRAPATLAYFRAEHASCGKLIDEDGMVASRQTIDKCASVVLASPGQGPSARAPPRSSRYSWIRNQRSQFVSRMRPRTLRRSTAS